MAAPHKIRPKIWKSIVRRTCVYLKDELQMDVHIEAPAVTDANALVLRDMTAIVGTSGPVSLLIAFSFDKALAEHLYRMATDGIEVMAHERETYARESIGDIVNIVVGHSTADLASKKNDMYLSTPVIIEETRHIYRPRDAVFTYVPLKTCFGILDINFVGPRDLFDSQLNAL